MRAWLSLPVRDFLTLTSLDVAARLAYAQAARHATLELAQRHAWETGARILQGALAGADPGWRLLLECDLLRLERRIDAVLLTDRAIVVLEFKHGARGFVAADLRQTEDYALDLHDFHAGSRRHPVVPVLVATEAPDPPPFEPPLLWHGVAAPVLRANAATLASLIAAVQAGIGPPPRPLDPEAWEGAPCRRCWRRRRCSIAATRWRRSPRPAPTRRT